jgi:hypothetical protein
VAPCNRMLISQTWPKYLKSNGLSQSFISFYSIRATRSCSRISAHSRLPRGRSPVHASTVRCSVKAVDGTEDSRLRPSFRGPSKDSKEGNTLRNGHVQIHTSGRLRHLLEFGLEFLAHLLVGFCLRQQRAGQALKTRSEGI